MSISSEDDLVVYLGRKELTYYLDYPVTDVYPKVSIIARRIEVSPDIDLLKIARVGNETVGYEVKYLKYRKDWKRFSYRPIYEGLGEALLYFNYGVDKVFLTIGYDTASVPRRARNRMFAKIGDVKSSLVLRRLSTVLGLRTIEMKEGSVISDEVFIEEEPKVKKWIALTDEVTKVRYRKQCLLNREFQWNRSLYEKIHSNTTSA